MNIEAGTTKRRDGLMGRDGKKECEQANRFEGTEDDK
jgi:hypothetical protein